MTIDKNNPMSAVDSAKKKRTKGGASASIGAILFSAMGYAFVNMRYNPEKSNAGEAIAKGATESLATIAGIPMLIGGGILGVIAIILVITKLRSAKATGWILSIIWIGLSAWAIKLAISGFSLIGS